MTGERDLFTASELPASQLAGLRCAFPPLHRVERALLADGQTVGLLSALRPEQGWPRFWVWLPVAETAEGRLQPLQQGPLLAQAWLQAFVAPQAAPGDALRGQLPLAYFPPARDPAGRRCGLLCLFVYADLRSQRRQQGGAVRSAGLEQALQDALAMPPDELRPGFTPRPSERPEEAEAEGLSFVLAACQYPPGLFDPQQAADVAPAHAGPAHASLSRLLHFCRSAGAGEAVSLLLLAGDAIYADPSGGLADAHNSVERFARPYQQLKAGLLRQLPPSVERIVHGLDDHEIEDNWEPRADRERPAQSTVGPYFASAIDAAWAARWEAGERPGLREHFWHHFDWRGAAFFVADARSERQWRHLEVLDSAHIMGAAQRQALRHWLRDRAERPRFVMSGSMLLPRRMSVREQPAMALRSDAWDGYPASLHALLAMLWAEQARGVVFLSGDEHRSGHVSAEISLVSGDARGRAPVRLHSIHSSALYAPWPFAVSRVEDFAAPDRFEFPGPEGQVLCCTVSRWADHPGDGFALLRLQPQGGRSCCLQLWYDKARRPLLQDGQLRRPDAELALG
ncbi:alkaline phosphatase D family protein [Paucibacter sp. APW11]|uniref:Alkaline phosphatase D family protein n=1 Tax=Roseateles aquae TaxID=3077235 RepID=A0ABU3PBR1_9BURK|nr:alkaline phosphatase D family protein [Paucibacter sp. APW11]MDT9000009.1 alkaline phosphatase D family protein [Paucibacter sp. APW11]